MVHKGYDWFIDHCKQTVIPRGTTVQIQGDRCDGILDCWDGIDEDFCGLNSFETVGIGKQFKNLEVIKGLRSSLEDNCLAISCS